MEHTKGKWYIEGEFGHNRAVYLKSQEGDKTAYLATLNSLEDGKDNAAKIEEAKANARLIAAAPEMFRVLKEYIRHNDSDESNLQMKMWLDETGIPSMRQAIAKAEGRR